MKKEKSADVIVVGGGVVGCATAYCLAGMGKKVIILEKSYVASQGSGRNAGGVRAQGRLPAELPVVLQAIEIWDTLDKELDTPTEFRHTGNIFLATTDREMYLHEKMSERLRRDGLDGVRVISEEEVRKIIPSLAPGMCKGASYSVIDGMANPIYTTNGYARAAVRKGAEIYENTAVERINVKGGRVAGVTAAEVEFFAEHVLVATSSWTPGLMKPLGWDVPISPCRNQIFVTEVIPPLVEPFFLAPTVYCNQTYNGNMFVGNVDPDDYCMGNSANPNETKKTSRDIIRYFPALSTINVIRAWGGPLDLTPDDMPILGDVPGIEGLVIGCGFSGHGFASSPFVGKMLGEHIGRGRSPLSLYPFRLSRFTELHEETGEEMYAYGQAIGKNRS